MPSFARQLTNAELLGHLAGETDVALTAERELKNRSLSDAEPFDVDAARVRAQRARAALLG